MNEDELNEKLMAELTEALFPDLDKQAMQVASAKVEMQDFIESLSDEHLRIIVKMIGLHRGQDQETWFTGVQQFAGMLYYEEMRRNRAKQFAEIPNAS